MATADMSDNNMNMSFLDSFPNPLQDHQSPSSPSVGSPSGHAAQKRRRLASKDGEKRERCANACNRCKSKKLKCYKNDSFDKICGRCAKAKEECVFEEAKPPGPSKSVASLEARIRQLETQLASAQAARSDLGDEGRHRDYQASPAGPSSSIGQSPGLSFLSILNTSTGSGWGQTELASNLGAFFQSDRPPSVIPNPALPTPQTADFIFEAAYLHIHCRYPFLDWPRIRTWWNRRDSLGTENDDRIGSFFVWAMCAAGVQLEPRVKGVDTAETYFSQAWKFIDAAMPGQNLVTIQALLLATFYAFRAPSGPSLALLVAVTMRLCTDLGLHRRNVTTGDPVEDERRKRVFWSAYAFDRLYAQSSGRPVTLADGDIDVSTPLDIDSETTDPITILDRLSNPLPRFVRESVTDLSSAIHLIELYRIRSRIHTTFYSLDAGPPTNDATSHFLTELEDWRKNIPISEPRTVPMGAFNRFQMRYYQCVLLTLRPALLHHPSNDPRLVLCASAAADLCLLDREIHHGPVSKQTVVSVCNTFVCGMTLLYCLSISPSVLPHRRSSRAIRSCSATLAVFTQTYREAVPFYELFEHIADDILAEGQGGAPQTVSAIRQVLEGNYQPLAAMYKSLEHGDRAPMAAASTSHPSQLSDLSSTAPTGLSPFLSGPFPDHPAEFSMTPFTNIEGVLNFTFDDSGVRW